MIDIFNLDNISDLPQNIVSQLRLGCVRDKLIIELFKIKNSLSTDEIIVGLARKNPNDCLTRSQVNGRLWFLSKKKIIKRVGPRLYELNIKNKS